MSQPLANVGLLENSPVDVVKFANLLHALEKHLRPRAHTDYQRSLVEKMSELRNGLHAFAQSKPIYRPLTGSKRLAEKRRTIFQRDGYVCQHCWQYKSEDELEMQHIVPIAEGGSHHPHNLTTVCHDCHQLLKL